MKHWKCPKCGRVVTVHKGVTSVTCRCKPNVPRVAACVPVDDGSGDVSDQ